LANKQIARIFGVVIGHSFDKDNGTTSSRVGVYDFGSKPKSGYFINSINIEGQHPLGTKVIVTVEVDDAVE